MLSKLGVSTQHITLPSLPDPSSFLSDLPADLRVICLYVTQVRGGGGTSHRSGGGVTQVRGGGASHR